MVAAAVVFIRRWCAMEVVVVGVGVVFFAVDADAADTGAADTDAADTDAADTDAADTDNNGDDDDGDDIDAASVKACWAPERNPCRCSISPIAMSVDFLSSLFGSFKAREC